MATVPQYFRDLYPTPCENAPAPHTIKNFLKKIDQRSYEGKVQELWDYLAGEFTGSLEPLEPFSEHIRKGGEFSDYQNFPLDRIRYEGPQGTTRSYSGSSFCEKYTKRRSEHGVEDYLKRHKPDLVFAASRAHEQSTKRDKKRRKPNDQPDQSTHSKTSKFYQDFELESNEYLDSILSLVFELKGRRELPSKPFLQEAVYLIASYDACGCYLGGFAVGKEFACMVVINKETILFEVPEDTHLTTLGIDDMMAFLAHDFSFPHAFSDDAEDLDFIWRYFNIAWDAIKDLPFGRRLPRVPQPPWLSREGVGEKLDIPLVELGGVHERLADFLKHVHRVKPKTATTSSSNVLSGNLDSVPTASRPRSQSPPRQYDLQGEASSSLTPISNLEQEEEMSNVDDEDGADEEHDEEEEDDDGSDNPNPDSTGNGKKDDPGDDPSGNLGGSGDGADPGMGGGIGGAANTTSDPAPGDGGSSHQQESSSDHAGRADQRGVARVGDNGLSLALETGPRRLLTGKTSEEEILKTPTFDNHLSTKDVDDWLSSIPTFTPHDLLFGENDNTLPDEPPSYSKTTGSNNTSEDKSLGMGEVDPARMAEREDRPETPERSESPCESENAGGPDRLAFLEILRERKLKFVLTEKSLFRAIVDNIKASPRV